MFLLFLQLYNFYKKILKSEVVIYLFFRLVDNKCKKNGLHRKKFLLLHYLLTN
jgi:hypothetical protein